MTRDEALSKLWAETRSTCTEGTMIDFVDMAESLGMLKLDKPERPLDPETRAGNILERYVGATCVASILTEFMGAGLAIVERGAKIDTSSGE